MIHIFKMIMIQIMASIVVIVVSLFLFATFGWTHEGEHRWLQKMHHPVTGIDCCDPDGDCLRVKVTPILNGDEWVVQFHGQVYRWPVEETTMGIDEHFWICFTKHHPDGPESFRNLDRNRPRCLITPAIG